MINIIDRYISKKFMAFFFGGLIVFVTIFLAVDSISSMVRYNVPSSVVMKYYFYYLPAIAYQMVPVGCLLATVFTLSSLNRTSELVALFSVGMSLARVSAPILVMVALISGIFFWVGDRILPKFAQKKNYVYYVDIKKKPGLYSTVKKNKIWYRSENILFNIQTLNSEKAKAEGLTLYYFDEAWELIQLVKAKVVALDGSTWKLSDGNVTLFAKESSFPLTQSFESKIITMNEDLADLQKSSHSIETMTLGELSRFIKKNKEAGLDTLRYEVEYHGKFGFAMAAFVMSLLGIPFSISRQRSGGTFLNVGVCIGLTFLYWALYSSSLTMGKHGALPPILAAWTPNLAVTGLALFLLFRLKK